MDAHPSYSASPLFLILGIFSTVWFLVRVIPKPGRAAYPCMRAAAPFMSGFIVYVLGVGGLTFISRNFGGDINVRYLSAFFLTFGVMITMAITPSDSQL